MDTLFENVYDVLFRPQEAMRKIADNQNILQSVLVVFVSVLIPMWALYFSLKTGGFQQAAGVVLTFELLGSLLVWILGAAVWHLVAEFFGGRGSVLGLLAALGFAHFPRVLFVPLWVFSSLMPEVIRPVLLAVSFLVIIFWNLLLNVYAFKGTYRISTAKATLILLTPMLAGMVIAAVLVVLVSALVIPWPSTVI
ncbi:putative membrane protein [Propionispora sp. 2/2-37]|uniref:Yip1 family protein n=1 Tax=Propionispora sp. 2/2-37 TaxID=1677858 RepID=UPI0006C4C781|nr:Yip1 family protein [Propionispora sp. 2/2-37]CUH96491.1 putative membrane protein [Propionispora sp. 2/2-37]